MRNCLACNTPLVGRIDKKFCDYNCRNAHHNFLNQPSNNQLSKINRQLIKNHRILQEFIDGDVRSIPLSVLKAMGYNEDLRTSVVDDPNDGRIYFIYDISYQQNESEIVLVTKELETYRQTA